MLQRKIKGLITILAVSMSSTALADWPVAITEKVAFHPLQKVISIGALKNDIGDGLYISSVNEWSENGGSILILNTSGSQTISYQAPDDYDHVGEDGFWYNITDDQGRTNAVRVSIDVKSVYSDLPSPQEDVASVPKNRSVRIDVLNNDLFSNVDKKWNFEDRGVIKEFNEWSQQGGTIEKVEVYSDVTELSESYPNYFESQKYQLKYTPKPSFTGEDTFWYVVEDSEADQLVTTPQFTKVTINVVDTEEIPDAYPVAQEDNVTGSCASGAGCGIASTIRVLENDTGKDLVLKLNSPWSLNGSQVKVVPNYPNEPYISYKAAGGPFQEDKVWYIIEDAYGRKNWGVININ